MSALLKSPLLKRIAFVVSILVLLAVGGWAQWSIFLNHPAPVDTPVAEEPRVDVGRIQAEAARTSEPTVAAEPSVRPAPTPERRPVTGAAERGSSTGPSDGPDMDFAQGQPTPPEARVEPGPAPAPASAETRQTVVPATPEKQSAREQEQEREAKRAQEEAEARKAAAAKREKADKSDKSDKSDQRSGRPSFSYRDRPSFPDRDAIPSRREVRAFIREHLEDLPARFRRPPPWAR